MTLGIAAAPGVWLIVWCKGCRHQVEPDPAEMAARYGAEKTVIDWRGRLVSSQCRSHTGRDVGERDGTTPRVARAPDATPRQPLGWGRNAHDAERDHGSPVAVMER
jgi:hypothetical protein